MYCPERGVTAGVIEVDAKNRANDGVFACAVLDPSVVSAKIEITVDDALCIRGPRDQDEGKQKRDPMVHSRTPHVFCFDIYVEVI
jgi:hypothetical protein